MCFPHGGWQIRRKKWCNMQAVHRNSVIYVQRTHRHTHTVSPAVLTTPQLVKFYISLTVHLSINLVNNQLDALFSTYLFISLPTYFEQPSAHHQENRILSIHHLVCVTMCRWLPGMPVLPDRHTRQSPTQSDIYQMTYWRNLILLMMSTALLETFREGK